MQTPEKIALIDMDGTLVDYDGAMRAALAKITSPGEVWDEKASWAEARKNIIKNQPGFWLNLPPIKEGFRVLGLITEVGFETVVLTKGPYRTTSAWAEKVEWNRRHLPETPVTITEDKGLVYGRVLFDDWPAYMLRWLQWRPRGLGVMLESPWNQDFAHPNVVKIRVGDGFEEDLNNLRPLLQAAYDR